jgi:hypothetical protein
MKKFHWLIVTVAIALLAIALGLGCGSTSSSGTSAADDDASPADDDASPADDDASPADDDATTAAWVWTPVDGVICRDGSATGYALRLQPGATNLMIFLQGGGACYSPSSCSDNPAHFGESDFATWTTGTGAQGILNDQNAANPVKDWNVAYVPYCTGDLHAGSKTNGAAPDVPGTQQFVGYQNIKKILAALKVQFPEPSRILLGGESAGGFGTVLNYAQTARTWPTVPVALLDDSGPLFSDQQVLAPCLELLVTLLWDADPVIADGCTSCFEAGGGMYSGWHKWLADTFPMGTFGLYSSMEDETIRSFFGIGQDNCTGTTDIPGDVYEQGLLDLRTLITPTKKWTTYYIPGDSHTATMEDSTFFGTTDDGVALSTWVGELLTGVPGNVGP